MRTVKYNGQHNEVFVPLLNKAVQKGQSIEVSDNEAGQLLGNTNFVEVKESRQVKETKEMKK